MMKIDEKVLKGAGFAISAMGLVISLASDCIANKQLDMKIEKKIMEALANANKN